MKKKSVYLTIALILIFVVISLIALNIPSTINRKKADAKGKKVKNNLPQGEVVFYTKDNKEITRIIIEVAADDYSRSMGLMFREKLPFSQGMLFIFDNDAIQNFWMKNTPLSLDMIFINKDKKIIKIHKGTKPYSMQSYSSIKPSRYVVEVNTGFSDSFQIKEGDRIDWHIF